MNKCILFLTGISFFTSNAQSLMVHYEEKANIENQLKHVTDPQIRKNVSAHLSQPRNFILYYKDGISLYLQDNELIKVSGLSLEEMGNTRKANIDQNSGGLYKNHKTGEYVSEADIFGKKFLVIDRMKKYDWILTNEEKKIATYKVKKASAMINGENITAWYTEELPIKEGPEDYYGLPGLIIEVSTNNKTYIAVDSSTVDPKFNITKPSQGEPISKEKYDKLVNETINRLKQQGMGKPPGN
ncbi:GLPGLI family protein [Chryseobacterium sp. JUb7]|uniref:GLPGLI family protein n=1 Tax=Chryseobacterium sp. JUb7 TaxID=2940599 RepID=UPI0021694FA6|nr:GLPGLI family protein [Chryseobacterium sp. JUb7]MCS3528871.1 GLPGLI family protein [Chryseobacterium sp. JUb7]